jgi:hypothetical protein
MGPKSGLAAILLIVVAACVVGAGALYTYQGYQSWKQERASVITILNTNLQNGRLAMPAPPQPVPEKKD